MARIRANGVLKSWKVKAHYGKIFLRRWATDLLPTEVLWRKKRGFHVPLEKWFFRE
ncbi:asparagine synthase-related protein [Thermosulfuriphilus sp.]